AMTGARMPTAAVTTTRISPTRTILRRVSARSAAGTRGRSDTSRGRATTLIVRGESRERADEVREPASSTIFHPGIDHQIREVDEQVHEHVHARDDEHHALHDGIVTPEHRRDDQPAEPWNVEDGFHDHRTGDEHRETDADHRHRRHERVAERVLVDDGALCEALGASRG